MKEISNNIKFQLRKSPWIRRRIIHRSLVENDFVLENELEYKRAFDFLDIDKDGFVSIADLISIVKLMDDKAPSDSDVNRWIRVFDMNHDVEISFEEFVATMIVKMENFMSQNEIFELFRKCDVQNEGYITTENIIEVMASQGEHLKVSEARMMLREVSSSRKSRIEITEFHRMMEIMRKDILFCVGAILSSSV